VSVDVVALKERVDLLELIGRDTRLKRVASTRGGEYAGACPFCGGRDRLRVQPARGRWWCRGCLGAQRWQDVIAYVQRRDGIDDFAEACRRLGASQSEQGVRVTSSFVANPAPKSADSGAEIQLAEDLEPSTAWRECGLGFVDECQRTLWSPTGERARLYLHGRGLGDRTLRVWQVGFQPHYGRYEPAAAWGFLHANPNEPPVYVPRGIVLPWLAEEKLGHIQVRTSSHDRQERYLSLRGGHPWLFGADTLVADAPAVLLEGALDTLLVWQEAGDLLGAASLGSCRKLPSRRALELLIRCQPLFEAYDADLEGEAGAVRLRQILADLVRVRPPAGKDPTRFHQRGGSVRDWLEQALIEHPTAEKSPMLRGTYVLR